MNGYLIKYSSGVIRKTLTKQLNGVHKEHGAEELKQVLNINIENERA